MRVPRFHLATLLAGTAASAAVIALNVRPRVERGLGHDYVDPGVHVYCLEEDIRSIRRGWPWEVYRSWEISLQALEGRTRDRDDGPVQWLDGRGLMNDGMRHPRWHLRLSANCAVALAIVLACAGGCETLLRRRRRRQVPPIPSNDTANTP